jgi:DNA-binding response OmpR family regulator
MKTGRPKLLIAEDDPTQVDIMREVLEQDFAVATACDGREAVAKARKVRPDVVLVDAGMPHMNGYQTCRALRDRPETADVPIIMVTAHSKPSGARAAFAAGATDYLAKPYTIGQLRARARTWLMRGANAH